jgi:hypothetical protein
MEARSKLNSMRNDRLAAVAQQQAHERSMPVSAGHRLPLSLELHPIVDQKRMF